MREKYDTLWGKFDSPITRYVYENVILHGFSDDSASSEASGEWIDRVGRRLVFGDDRGFVYSEKYPTVAAAALDFERVAAAINQEVICNDN